MGISVFKVPRRLYWTADKTRLVEHGDVEAAYLAFPAGAELALEEARRYRLLDTLDTPVVAPVDPVEVKLGAEPENKLGARMADKAIPVEVDAVERPARRVTRR